MEGNRPDLVCISHLWWDWVWQRPQHLMSRLARQYRVFWTEEPRIEIGPESEGFEVAEETPNLTISRLVYRSDAATFWRRLNETLDRTGAHGFKPRETLQEATLRFDSPVQERLEREVREYVAAWRRGPLVLWLYTPVVVQFIDLLQPDLVIYDVMDELSAFKFASPRLREQERELFTRADLVFAGGPSLYEARRSRHADLHHFPSGVEEAHFARALEEDLPLPSDVRELGHPIIGFFGVIDERMDLALLERIAAARPDWQLVLVGPVMKIEDSTLPRLANIHYTGQQDYQQLPAYLKAFDVAILPFALDESTRFLSPTKTLEYMAAHKPIVSTPLPDVISLYGSVVRIAENPEQFIGEIQAALDESPQEREERMRQERDLLHQHSWDQIAAEMQALIEDRLTRKRATSDE